MKKEWFADWFDSKYYHILYQHRDYSEAARFVDNLVDYLSLPNSSILLDLACGQGRHAIHLAKKGFTVTGLDLSRKSILEAQKTVLPNLEFYEHDMRKPFRSNYFDVIFNLFTSFGYFDDIKENQRAINHVYSGLKPNGIFVMDFLNLNWVKAGLVEKEQKTIDGITFDIQREISNGKIRKKIRFEAEGQLFAFEEQVAALDKTAIISYIENAGLKLLQSFGDYDLQPFNEHSSSRLILIAKKDA